MTRSNEFKKLTYALSGVDTEAGEKAVQLMQESILKTKRPEVFGDFGGFVGLFDASKLKKFKNPILATSTDGVGTKIDIAKRMSIYNTIGIDLVAMVVDDLVVCGAEPLFLTDYIAVGQLNPEKVASIVSGIAQGCQIARCALLGGETAEHPGLMANDDFDVAGAGTGVVDANKILSSNRVKSGDVVVAIESSGLHSNGYSLARYIMFELASQRVEDFVSDFGRTIGEELLEPTTIYTPVMLDCMETFEIHSMAHITGGGIAANLARVLPAWAEVIIDRNTWNPKPIFQYLVNVGKIDIKEAESSFNMGIGMAVVVSRHVATELVTHLKELGLESWVAGEVSIKNKKMEKMSNAKSGIGGFVRLEGSYAFDKK